MTSKFVRNPRPTRSTSWTCVFWGPRELTFQTVRIRSRLRTANPSQRSGTVSACLWEHVTLCCNAASSPGASRKRVPPSLDVPSGNTLGSITQQSNKCPSAADPAPARFMARYHSHSPPATCPRPDGRRFPPTHGSAPLHRRPPRRHPHRKEFHAPPPASSHWGQMRR